MSSPLLMSGRTDVTLYMPLNEVSAGTTQDYSGNGNTGTDTGTAVLKGTNGLRYRNFDGSSNDYITPGFTNADTNLTINTWVNFPSSPYNSGNLPIVGADDGSPRNYQFTVNGGNGFVGMVIFIGGSNYSATGTTNLKGAGWAMVTTTFDGSNVKVYVNCIEEDSTAASGSLNTGQDVYVGATLYSGGAFFDGDISDVLLLNRAITLAEIKALYRATYRV